MAQEYTITKISEQAPRQWQGPHGVIYYIKILVEGHEKLLSIGKKSPDALKVGDSIYGTIEESDLPEDKFKSERRPDYRQGSNEDWEDKQKQIRAQWAIGQAVQLCMVENNLDTDNIEIRANELFAMVDRVKESVITDTDKSENF